jgi:hypothetical protein
MDARNRPRAFLFTASTAFAIAMTVLPFAITNAAVVRNQAEQDVLTYHNDTLRTGWNSNETQLTTSNVNASNFGLLATAALDGRVDAQPLIVTQQNIAGEGTHDVAYVATENDTLYALDADTGAVLWSTNFGSPVPYEYKQYDDNIYPVMGILGTPVIDRGLNAIFLVADTFSGSSDAFAIHAVALDTGADLMTPVVISAGTLLKNGKPWVFDSQYDLQRPGLLEANGNIYVAFGSTGDSSPAVQRGTLVSYGTTTLAPQASGVTDRLNQPKTPFYLSSIWQSGYALAGDGSGNVYFSTGNSNDAIPSFDATYNHPESVLKVSGDLSTLLSYFTPADYFQLDQYDGDVGAGGTMVLPPQSGKVKNMVVAGGKDGRTFLLDADKLGEYHKNADKVLAEVDEGACWCGPAYFVGSDGTSRVVTGGANGVTTWKLLASGKPTLVQEYTTGPSVVSGLADDGGTIPTISSNGTAPGTAIVWFLQRPATSSDNEPGTPITMWAYDLTNLTTPLYSVQAGTWRHADNSNATLLPTVANGKVYVASEKQLQIFGLLSENRRRGGRLHG